jgi:TolB-like protein/Tfp pilus assembly protein PilF
MVEENEYFSDGVTEDIISQLSKISDLRVISRTSVMRYKNSDKSVKEIGKDLNVASILEGSVRREANKVRIVAQLISSRKDENLWSETYDRELTEIFAIQSDVARQIANTLAATLLPKEEQLISQTPTDNLDAYSLCLKSRHHFLSYKMDDFEQGIQLAKRAIELDPNYALAYAGLAEAYYRATTHLLSPNESMPKAKEAALRALGIDETVSRAHMALAVVLYRYEYDWDNAEKHFRIALELSPGDATIHEEYGLYFLTCLGRFDEALSQLNHALKLDPYSAIINVKLSFLYYFKGDYERALDQANHTIRLHSDYGYAYLFRGIAHGALGHHSEAIDDFERLLEMGISTDVGWPYMASAYLESGNEMKAAHLVEILKERVMERTDLAYYLAQIYALWGRKDEAFVWLSEAYANRSEQMMYLKIDHHLDGIRSDPRYNDMLKKIGLTP